MKTILWEKPNGTKITTNALPATVEACEEMKWKIVDKMGKDNPVEIKNESPEGLDALRGEFQQAFSDGMRTLRESFMEELSALRDEMTTDLNTLKEKFQGELNAIKEQPKEEKASTEEKAPAAKKKG